MEETTETHKPSIFCDLYKASMQIDQNKRRNKLLQEQKRRRENLLDEARGLNESLEVTQTVKHTRKYTKVREYDHKIMLSEWLIEVPEDFDVSWFMKFCPAGHRNLIVADKNSTKSYSKKGQFEYKFKSALPGGSYNSDKTTKATTILDCIWDASNNTFYILDVLLWSNQTFTDCDAEFRFFWLQSKISEIPELAIPSTNNTYIFKYIPHKICDHLTLKQSFETYPYFENDLPKVDGLLFYHKEASYTSGRTPLVGWLKSYMVPEILNIPVTEEYFREKPDKYVSLQEHIEYGKQIQLKKKHKKCENNVEMEVV